MINLHTVEFILNFIEYECDAIISNITWALWTTLFFVSFLSTYRKLWQCVQILLLYRYSYFIAVPERCMWRTSCTWVSILTMRSSKISSFLMFRILVISNVAHRESQRLQKCNVWHAKLLLLFLSDTAGWASVIELWCHWPYKKCVISLRIHSVPFSTSISRSYYHCRRRTCNLTVTSSPRKSSNRPFCIFNDAYR